MKIQDLSSWESFRLVAKEGNFTRAAAKLKIGAPLLSKRIALLEESLGVRLFQRTTRKVSLTAEARGLLPAVESLLADAQGLEDRFADKSELMGTIRIMCVTAFAHRILAPLLVNFSILHPKVNFEVEVTDTLIDLIDNQLDLAIRVQEPKGSDFVFKKLIQNRLVLCAAPSYLKKHNNSIRKPSDLHRHQILMLKVYENCQFKNSDLKLGDLDNAQRLRCENGLFLTELATRGGGIAVRSLWDVYHHLETGKLVQVLPNHLIDPFGDIYAIVPTRRLLAHRVRAFLEFIIADAKNWKF